MVKCWVQWRNDWIWFLTCCDGSSWRAWWEELFVRRHHRSHSQQDLIRDNKETSNHSMDNPRFFSSQSLNTSIAFLVPLFSFKVPVSGATDNSMSEMENIIQQIFVVFGFILLFSFGLIPLLVGIGQPTIGRWAPLKIVEVHDKRVHFQDVWLRPVKWNGQHPLSGLRSLHPGHGVGHNRWPWRWGSDVWVNLN